MKEYKAIEKSLVRKTLAWERMDKVTIKKGPFRGFAIYYNDWYIGCAYSMADIHSILSMINNMLYAVTIK